MKKYKITALLTGVFTFMIISGCLISSVNQPAAVTAGGTFTATLTVSEMTAETTNPHKGVLLVLVPQDWTFISGTFQSSVGNGTMVLNTDPAPVYGDIDTTIPPPAGMKWVDLISDQGFTHAANLVMETTVNFQVGTTTGTFPIGYAATKNTLDMLKSINPLDIDNDAAWTDTSMNHMVTVNAASAINEQLTGAPGEFDLSQNYPNPFNPSTSFSYTLKQSGDVQIILYDASGKQVETLADGFRSAGKYTVNFDAKNLSSGIYYYRITTADFVQTNKMVLIK